MDSTASTSAEDAPVPASVWTIERIRALGAVTDVATVGEIFGLSRSSAYELARGNRLPVPVLRVGSRYRISVAAILTVLGVPTEHPAPSPTT
ncbi:DNA-binding protein [Micromonospora aurantiaca]|uniref:helix-turn-helix domain-containing protein n=1 Tax=Micromonospora aurantiaca (nom. illeg.) TaxID=47850 RepID=UPI000F405556|nr:helix-turn-helix domain-containing protein [Micromonospora aurantiaca]RNH99694.1 DNA-binding protein [Micromonospora aurantiaca]